MYVETFHGRLHGLTVAAITANKNIKVSSSESNVNI